ncbi:hypothetical protein ACLOJK_014069 [Asimina triloba]
MRRRRRSNGYLSMLGQLGMAWIGRLAKRDRARGAHGNHRWRSEDSVPVIGLLFVHIIATEDAGDTEREQPLQHSRARSTTKGAFAFLHCCMQCIRKWRGLFFMGSALYGLSNSPCFLSLAFSTIRETGLGFFGYPNQ